MSQSDGEIEGKARGMRKLLMALKPAERELADEQVKTILTTPGIDLEPCEQCGEQALVTCTGNVVTVECSRPPRGCGHKKQETI
jgi:hypothetical protein